MAINAIQFCKNGGHGSWSYKDQMHMFNQLILKHHGGDWDCAKTVYERDGQLCCAGITDLIRKNFTDESISQLADLNYNGNKSKALSYISKKITPQFNRKFLQIYEKMKNNYGPLNAALNTNMVVDSVSNMSRSDKLRAAASISDILKGISQSDAKDILELAMSN